jgi:hypothetical protein
MRKEKTDGDFIREMATRCRNRAKRRRQRPENIAISILTQIVVDVDDRSEQERLIALFISLFRESVEMNRKPAAQPH